MGSELKSLNTHFHSTSLDYILGYIPFDKIIQSVKLTTSVVPQQVSLLRSSGGACVIK